MVHNTDKKLNLRSGGLCLLKRMLLMTLLSGILVLSCSCTLLTKSLDSRTGFSKHLVQVESGIRSENWQQARTSLEDSKKAWKRIKPLIQVDVDHDYVKDIEDGFVKLDGYLDTKDKPNSLVSILLLKSTWENIDSL